MINANIKEIELREKIINLALLQHHKLYVHGCHGPDTFDCAGFVWYLYYTICNCNLYSNGFGLSTTTKIMTSRHGQLITYEESNPNKNLKIIKKGDIVFFHRQSLKDSQPQTNNKYPGHCGIYLGNNNFIHCSRIKGKVIISNFNNNEYWKKILVAVKNMFSDMEELERYNYKFAYIESNDFYLNNPTKIKNANNFKSTNYHLVKSKKDIN